MTATAAAATPVERKVNQTVPIDREEIIDIASRPIGPGEPA
jgi:hypothetical protein